MSAESVIAELLKLAQARAVELGGLEAAFRELNTTMVDLLDLQQNKQPPDLVAAIQQIKPAVITVPPAVVQVPQTPAGQQWRIVYKRTLDGGEMTVTKL